MGVARAIPVNTTLCRLCRLRFRKLKNPRNMLSNSGGAEDCLPNMVSGASNSSIRTTGASPNLSLGAPIIHRSRLPGLSGHPPGTRRYSNGMPGSSRVFSKLQLDPKLRGRRHGVQPWGRVRARCSDPTESRDDVLWRVDCLTESCLQTTRCPLPWITEDPVWDRHPISAPPACGLGTCIRWLTASRICQNDGAAR